MKQQQQGFLLIASIIFIALLSSMAAVIVHIFSGQMEITAENSRASQALDLAEAGIEKGKHALLASNTNYRLSCSAITGDSSMTNLSFGQGLITVTATAYPTGSATTLSSAIDASTTTIPVISTANYAPHGRIQIDQEWMNYDLTTANSFTNVTRATNNSSAVAHTAGVSISQNQCALTTQTGVPDFSSTSAKRTLHEYGAAQLAAAWTVGETALSAETINMWDGVNWAQQGPYPSIPNNNLNGIFMLSYVEGWAVGNRNGGDALFIRWNGGTWSRVFPAASVPNKKFNAITCTTSNDCKAVGNNDSGKASIAHWNGTTWSQAADDGSLADENLSAITCVANNDCWAVGNEDGDAFFARWTGTQWARETSALVTTGSGQVPSDDMNAVYCVASNDCWAVGKREGGDALFVHWNGTQWARVTPSASVPYKDLTGVYCSASNDCWAVGKREGGDALFVHWNGTQWARVTPSANVPNKNLNAVHCSASDNCWAVGDDDPSGEVIVYWDGSTWVRVGPTASVANEKLKAVFVIGKSEQMLGAEYWEEAFS